MNADAYITPVAAEITQAETLLRRASAGLGAFVAQAAPLRGALTTAAALGNPTAIKAAARLLRKLDQFEPSITMIGQIKSGKTTLVNSLIGRPNLLPADVNPWTSVVTSLHLCPRALTPPTKAQFRFFENAEWDRLITGGGRIGELAERAGADDELSKIKEQVIAMREKSKQRLGRKFEILLGSDHSYGYFDRELVERYVCLGDDFGDQTVTTKAQGRFADITKSADLSMQQAGYPMNLCIRDTPGVNDTFLIREQITIKSIRDSRICVVVLSAHQALSATDLGLIRLISQAKSREVVIFVNRVDELADPVTQIGEIRGSIRATLKKHNCPVDTEILFGSALWAEHAVSGSLNSLPKASRKTLLTWAKAQGVKQGADDAAFMWDMSGLTGLLDALAQRIASGEGQELLTSIAAEADTLLNGIRMADNLDAKAHVGDMQLRVSERALLAGLDQIAAGAQRDLDAKIDALLGDFARRLARAHDTFLTRATDALAKHLEIYGEHTAWSYDPAGFRIMLNAAYSTFGIKCQSAYKTVAKETATAYQNLCGQALNLPANLYVPQFPPPPHVPPPVALGQTIALDLKGNWWKSWWTRRQSYQSQAVRYQELIRSETSNLVDDLRHDQAAQLRTLVAAQLTSFTEAQNNSFRGMIAGAADKPNLSRLFDVQTLQKRDKQLMDALSQLQSYADAD